MAELELDKSEAEVTSEEESHFYRNETQRKTRQKRKRKRKRCLCLEKGDTSVLLVLLGIASFCLAYYFTRDWRYVIQPVVPM